MRTSQKRGTPPWKSPGAAKRLAIAFSGRMARTLSIADLHSANRMNEEDVMNPDVCHTHDFCDANMVMDAAWRELGWSRWLPSDEHGEESFRLWNDAWDLAVRGAFNRDLITVIDIGQEGA